MFSRNCRSAEKMDLILDTVSTCKDGYRRFCYLLKRLPEVLNNPSKRCWPVWGLACRWLAWNQIMSKGNLGLTTCQTTPFRDSGTRTSVIQHSWVQCEGGNSGPGTNKKSVTVKGQHCHLFAGNNTQLGKLPKSICLKNARKRFFFFFRGVGADIS